MQLIFGDWLQLLRWWHAMTPSQDTYWTAVGVGVNLGLGFFAYSALVANRKMATAALEQTALLSRQAEQSGALMTAQLKDLELYFKPAVMIRPVKVVQSESESIVELRLTNLSRFAINFREYLMNGLSVVSQSSHWGGPDFIPSKSLSEPLLPNETITIAILDSQRFATVWTQARLSSGFMADFLDAIPTELSYPMGLTLYFTHVADLINWQCIQINIVLKDGVPTMQGYKGPLDANTGDFTS